MMRSATSFLLSALSVVLTTATQAQTPPLPDSSGWGVQVLALSRAPDSTIWVGTYGQGIFVLRPGAAWERITASNDTAAHSISWNFVHAFGFGARGEIWYGTVGNGWGVSTDGGKTWKNWEFRQLGPEWQYVAPNGIVTRGDTVYIGTADGIKLTWDNGATWRVVTDSAGATTARDSVWGRIKSQYVLYLQRDGRDRLVVWHLRGVAASQDGGRSWTERPAPSCRRSCQGNSGDEAVAAALSSIARSERAPAGAATSKPRHIWFRRPIAPDDQSYIDQTYRFGSTMGGNFQPHQGVEFNNPDGTPVHAIGDGVVVFSGPAEAGANTIAIRHSRQLKAENGRRLYVFSVYYHNTRLLVPSGRRVKAGDVIALVGNTGRATNDHLHLEVHAAPTTDSSLIVRADARYPPFNTNPELWIAPLPGTGLIAGQVWDSTGQPVPQARIYGLVKPEPQETPFSFIETYGPRNHADPVYHEHFAISDVPPGTYVLGVEIDGRRTYRRVHVEAGKLTWVEFRPEAGH